MSERDVVLPADEDARAEHAVLGILLGAYPAQCSVEEVVREMTHGADEFSARDRAHNAIRDLVGAGLLHRHGSFVFATRAAVRFDELQS